MKDSTVPLVGTVCSQDHGGPGNDATVYGHYGSARTCVRVEGSDTWVFDLKRGES